MKKYLVCSILLVISCNNDEPRIFPCGEGCEIVDELVNVTAKVIQWPMECNFILTTDSLAVNGLPGAVIDSTNILLSCNGLPPELMVEDTLVTVSGFKYNCCDEFTAHAYNFFQAVGCRFDVTSIEAAAIQLPIEPGPTCDESCEILEELVQIKARVFLWGLTCEYVLETDSALIASGKFLYLDYSQDILVPCLELPEDYFINQLLVVVSGFKYNCCTELELPTVDPGFGCRFEVTSIEPFD